VLNLSDRIAIFLGGRDLLGHGWGNLVGAQGSAIGNHIKDKVGYAFRQVLAHAGPK
jgi:hypothetical protein